MANANEKTLALYNKLRLQAEIKDSEYEVIWNFLGDCALFFESPVLLKEVFSVCQFGTGERGTERPWRFGEMLYLAVKDKELFKKYIEDDTITDSRDAITSCVNDTPPGTILEIFARYADTDEYARCIEVNRVYPPMV